MCIAEAVTLFIWINFVHLLWNLKAARNSIKTLENPVATVFPVIRRRVPFTEFKPLSANRAEQQTI
jgi:hypothetical protein